MNKIQHVRTPTGVLALIQPTAEKLLAEGVISGTINGDLHAADAAVVKAAIMGMAVCDFCSSPGASHFFDVPDFGVTMGNAGSYSSTKSTGGWMACDACDVLVRKNEREALVKRAIETMAFPKFSTRAIEEFLAKFWEGMEARADAAGIAAACGDFVEGRLPPLPAEVASLPKSERIEAVMRATRLERKQVVELLDGTLTHDAISKLVAFKHKCGDDSARMARVIAGHERPPLPDVTPHWQRALDTKYEALTMLRKTLGAMDKIAALQESTNLDDPVEMTKALQRAQAVMAMQDLQYGLDVACLQRAETYSFGADPIVAITEAAKLLPRDAPLSSVEVPTGAGWFWFSQPLDVTMTTVTPNDETKALLWGWTNVDGRRVNADHRDLDGSVAMRFSGFIMSDGKPFPATAWSWPLHMTLEEMLTFNRENYARDYEREGGIRSVAPKAIGLEATMRAIESLSTFFLAACVWFKQKILVSSQGHVERHARKRIMREHKETTPPSVRVIALRASARSQSAEPVEHASGTGRKLHVRYVVAGHPRLQRCGPGRADVKLIWIAPYPKGPEDAPFKERQKVFAVIR